MKSFLIIPALIAGITGLAGTASAQEFNGPSVGVQLGWGKTDVRNPDTEIGTATIDRTRDAFVGGVFVGYDQEVLPSVVIGAQADLTLAADDELTRRTATSSVTLDPKLAFDLTLRAGYVVAPSTLLYVRGGYANARVRTTISDPRGVRSDSSNRDGWTVGGGLERVIWDRVSARLEYRYADLSDGDGKFDRHQVLVGASYRF
ncbi:outer membrane protein [Sphingomonas xinjiangensis]|uniref:Outer membrane immunogenic protein n=1 Tax=Sphingomonas xinjiangensis TaxID=643568 RepID=A0A840YR86_9SPHN|nr:outer membrane protein [Sphingomonas xinjiangensis]MBB5711852.1 outer membrane immunogenic protein [Sphingomonas xinjiangensis]